jgi:hypothetical protein
MIGPTRENQDVADIIGRPAVRLVLAVAAQILHVVTVPTTGHAS